MKQAYDPAPPLAAFLLARIDDDEAVARAAMGTAAFGTQTGHWVYEQVPHVPSGTAIPVIFAVADGGGKTQVANMEAAWERDERAVHIVRHAPARVLAECEAKRRIVERARSAARWAATEGEADYADDGREYAGAVADAWHEALLALALPYAGHPDWREEWRP